MKKRIMEIIERVMKKKVLMIGGLVVVVTASVGTAVYLANKEEGQEAKNQVVASSVDESKNKINNKIEDKTDKKEEDEGNNKIEDKTNKEEEEKGKKETEEQTKKIEDKESKNGINDGAKRKIKESSKKVVASTTSSNKRTTNKQNTKTKASSNSSSKSSNQTKKTTPSVPTKPRVKAGINQSLTNGLNSRSGVNDFGVTQKASMFRDLTRQLALGNIGTGSVKSQISSIQPWEDTYNGGRRARYEVLSCKAVVYTTNANTAQSIDNYAMNSGYRVFGNFTYNVVYTNSNGTNKVARVAVTLAYSPK